MNVLNETNYSQTLDVIITGTSRNNDVFAITDDNEQVYINPDLVSVRTRVGDRLQVRVVPNSQARQAAGIKWRAYFVEPTAATVEPEVSQWQPPTDEQVIQFIENRGVVSTSDVVREFSFPTKVNNCRAQLDRLHREELLVRADLYVHQTQTKASHSLWAVHEDDFYCEEETHNG
jgi:hypothetical protein